jgi:cell fate regulator YaaT (PSP1 superfamily)
MRTCWINDCTGFDGKAPCCLDCEERTHYPDKCSMVDTADCGGYVSDGKGILKTDNQDKTRDSGT